MYWILALTGSQWSVLSSDAALICLTGKNATHVFNMHTHGKCFIYKDTKISDKLREWYVVARYGHRSKTKGDLTYLRLGTNDNELSFIIIHL